MNTKEAEGQAEWGLASALSHSRSCDSTTATANDSTTSGNNTCDRAPPILGDNSYRQQHAPAPWLWAYAGGDDTNIDAFDPTATLSDSAFPDSGELPWFHEPSQAIRPEHISLAELELTQTSLDYGSLHAIADWCDNADSFTRLQPTSPPPSSISTNDSSLNSLREQSTIPHSYVAPKKPKKSVHSQRIDPVRRWLHDHPFDRYPTAREKTELAAAAGISSLQLSRRLTNLRKRDRDTLDRLCNELDACAEVSAADVSQYYGPFETIGTPGRKGKRRYSSRYSLSASEGATVHPLRTSDDGDQYNAYRYHCTVCIRKSFKNPYSWKRHEAGVHGFGSTRWICLLDNDAIMTDMKCIFCSDTVHDLDHFDQHNVQVCLAKHKSARVFDRKDLLKQHVQHVHLSSANDYTKKGFEPPDTWSKTEDKFSSNPDGLWCGFCKCSFETTAVRMDHVAQHFRDGFQISTWVQRVKNPHNMVA